MMRMTLVTLIMLQLNTVMMGMGHGKLKRKQSKELLMLRTGPKSNNEDNENLMFAEYTPLRISTHAPRFKIIDNQQNTIEPSARTLKWKKKRKHKSRSKSTTQITTVTDLRNTESKNWRLELPVTKALENVTDHNIWRLDSRDYEATRIQRKPDNKDTLQTWQPDMNADTSVEDNSGLTDESESVDGTKAWNENLSNQDALPIFGAEVFKDKTIKKTEYIHTWRTFEPDEEASVSMKPEHQNIERLKSDDAETSEATEDSDSLRLDSGESDISEATETSKRNTEEGTLATKQTEASEVIKQTDYNTWRTWKHYTSKNTNKTATKVPENVKSTDNKAASENNWKKQIKASEPLKYPYGKLGARHLRIGSDESAFKDK